MVRPLLLACLFAIACTATPRNPPAGTSDMAAGTGDMRMRPGPDMATCIPGADGLHRDLACDPGCPTLGADLMPEGGSNCTSEGLQCVFISWIYTCTSGSWVYSARMFDMSVAD